MLSTVQTGSRIGPTLKEENLLRCCLIFLNKYNLVLLLITLSKTFKYFLINKSLASLALLQILASLKISLANFINCTAEHVSYFSKLSTGSF